MVARGPYTVDKDAWVAQLVGGSTWYGNGQGTLIHMGPVPQAGGGADFKSRGMFEISAADVTSFMASATSIDTAIITLIVGANTCLGSRGSGTFLFLEEMTGDFSEKAVSGCNLSSGSGTGVSGVWNASDNVTTTNRATFSGSSLSTGASITFDVGAIFAARLAAGDVTSAFRFRVISAKSDFSAYDETTSARRISVCSREDATSGNRPSLSGTVTTGSLSKSASESIAVTDTFSVSQSGISPAFGESIAVTDTFSVAAAPWWSAVLGADGNGLARLTMPTAGPTGRAYLDSVNTLDVQARAVFRFSALALGGVSWAILMARYSRSPETYYQVRAKCNGQTQAIDLFIDLYVNGVPTLGIQQVNAIRAFSAQTDYWLYIQCKGTNPTIVSAKVWRTDEAEPGWQLTVNDSTVGLQDAGSVGIAGGLSSTVTNAPIEMRIDNFEAYAAI